MTTLIKTKTIEFEKLIPDFKRFVASKKIAESYKNRKVLKYLYFDGQYLKATDSHKAIRVNTEYITDLPSNNPFLYDLKNMQIVEEDLNFPEIKRFIPDLYSTSVELHDKTLKEFKNTVDKLLKLDSVKETQNKVINFQIDNKNMTVKDNEETNTHKLECFTTGKDIKFSINCKYMKDALMTINKLNKLSYDDPSMNIVSNMRPINICKENVFDIVVLPVRIP